MREQLKVKFASPEQVPEMGEWIVNTPGNLFDKSILSYPTLRVLCSYNGIGSCAYLPMQQALVLESLAVKPGLEPMLAAQAFKDLVKGSEIVASSNGNREIYFLCKDENVVRMAENHGFGRVEWPVVRLKL